MPRYNLPDYYETVEEALMEGYTAPVVKDICKLLTSKPPIRKSDMVASICSALKGDGLHSIWTRMDDLEQTAVSEIVHSPDNQLDTSKFMAKYGDLPNTGYVSEYGDRKPTLINLLIINGTMPEELKVRLKDFVPEPRSYTIETQDDISDTFIQESYKYDYQSNERVAVMNEIPMIKMDTEMLALHDVLSVLRIIDSGKISVSDKTKRPTESGARTIASILEQGDFYDSDKNVDNSKIGHIKAFAWPLIAQSAKLAELAGRKLQLTKLGQKALNSPPHEIIRILWSKWLRTTIIDEFNRVDAIKGQNGKGRRGLSAVSERRRCIVDTLSLCPVGKWISVENLFKSIRALDNNFIVTRNEWSLYICELRYGSLGYDGSHTWEILQGRYTLAFLFEYAATMGIIDVAYIPPAMARDDYRALWGTDDLMFLSRYDGLQFIRINPLGAWCLGLSESYKAAPIEKRYVLKVLPNREITETKAPFPHSEAIFLETIADKTSDKVWKLNPDKILIWYEKGKSIEEIKKFLLSKSEQDLPDTVVSFFDDMIRRNKLLSDEGSARLIKVSDPVVALTLANDSRLKDLCIAAEDGFIAVPSSKENAFRKKLRKMGYGI
ncbi:MAG: hypothetical protein D8M57_07995 [Candidatus Scalindua sp. AMX11]|nr:MAG: hypothetical protein DWQ00_11595 [Candidatus Scalindua sp.]NOG85312.1 hypothetical protein [Planctomycetota bacterium]RZV81471.1 MAG: hypothetical protein EX341_10140 [Candidatus Scalindua sp. SCAELEC01]TDE65456.1 MAG: hypothetical protein D8M57_07995 [Candidatus Scalindua sp. AMX11]GJQ59380.1 MAG: hypothetical protein SCALA701_21810 [Candidatus Scalindua sp.]